MSTKPPLQKILQGILHTEDESKQNHKRTGNTKPQEKKDKESDSNIFFKLFKTFINRCLQFVDFFEKNQVVNFYYKLKMKFLKIST
jgi:hypothetical protein